MRPEYKSSIKSISMIAVDGPAASGKGTLSRRLADYFSYNYLDTGSLYRAVAVRILQDRQDPNLSTICEYVAQNLDEKDLVNPKLRDEKTGQVASIVSAHPAVRVALLKYQREFARLKPGAVLDGRDIGTLVIPEAKAKIFLEASLKKRAQRRSKELRLRGVESIEFHVLQEMKDRDTRDSSRAVAPLRPADDALIIDTTYLSADEVFEKALLYVEARLP